MKFYKIFAFIVIIALIVGGLFLYYTNNNKPATVETANKVENTTAETEQEEKTDKKPSNAINVVATLDDEITGDSAWCGTVNLIWNDFKSYLKTDKPVQLSPEKELNIVANLNKSSFTSKELSDDHYYTNFGYATPNFRDEIKGDIRTKFDQKSDILDNLRWEEGSRRIVFYAMLYRNFNYPYKFEKLGKASFAKKDNVEYFGVTKSSDKDIKNQIDVLYYNNDSDYAVKILTKENDEVIFVRNPEGKTFGQIYENMNINANKFKGSTKLGDSDTFKAPMLKINEEKDYVDMKNVVMAAKDGEQYEIEKLIQTIKFRIDEEGGEIKSEAAMVVSKGMAISEAKEERNFNFDDEFVLFLKEKDKEKPYFATKVSTIDLYK